MSAHNINARKSQALREAVSKTSNKRIDYNSAFESQYMSTNVIMLKALDKISKSTHDGDEISTERLEQLFKRVWYIEQQQLRQESVIPDPTRVEGPPASLLEKDIGHASHVYGEDRHELDGYSSHCDTLLDASIHHSTHDGLTGGLGKDFRLLYYIPVVCCHPKRDDEYTNAPSLPLLNKRIF